VLAQLQPPGDFLIGRGSMSSPFANYQAVILRKRCCSTVKAASESGSTCYDGVNYQARVSRGNKRPRLYVANRREGLARGLTAPREPLCSKMFDEAISAIAGSAIAKILSKLAPASMTSEFAAVPFPLSLFPLRLSTGDISAPMALNPFGRNGSPRGFAQRNSQSDRNLANGLWLSVHETCDLFN
jgi:hypothetical protein